MIVGTCT